MSRKRRKIDCTEAADRLYEYLDEELTPELADEVRAHLERCADCLAVTNFETAYLRFLEARTRASGAPDNLRRRILEQLLFTPEEPEST